MIKQFKSIVFAPILLVVAICLVFTIDAILPIDFNRFGIRPRTLFGLLGIPISPFLHGDLNHIVGNIPPLFFLAILVCSYGQRFFYITTAILIVMSGLLTWTLSSAGIVIGASSLVFAYWAYLVTTGIRLKTFKTILLAVLTLLFYGGLIFGLASVESNVSWAGHFSGALAGLLLAFLMLPPDQTY